MGSRPLALLLAAQAALFAIGALAWLAFTRGLYANALLCVLAAAALAVALSQRLLSGRPLAARAALPSEAFAADLSRRRLQMLLDQTPSPILLRGQDDQVIAVNRAARQLFDTPYALSSAARRALTDGQPLRDLVTPVRWRDAAYAVSRAELVENGQAADLVVLTDISADVRAAEASALRDLLRVLNHELMNALTPVASMSRSALDLLRDGGDQATATAIKALERVVARTAGLQDFINAYRAMTRLPPPVRVLADLPTWFDVACESFEAQWRDKGVALERQTPPGIEVRLDEDQMWLAIGNLLNNAAQAALDRPAQRVRLSAERVGETLHLTVEDSGPGVAPDQADQVFLPFYTTKATGSGVGLSLARQIVQAHGGSLVLLPAEPGDPDRLGGARLRVSLAL
ncbi:sensor histidine kinase [Caulobacter hibisci]|uniref:histidine kinase n=1 Tax=Caulobacter hibisci TaxID=2035993 RepID=A0ABS0T367_9CAUL|nr:HAMP domain-containing sensor histidine kinase [Caulobacter hibisci]MBI1686099.1 HAMP domain-containing histidine kinase [Caulobacter hibisci]